MLSSAQAGRVQNNYRKRSAQDLCTGRALASKESWLCRMLGLAGRSRDSVVCDRDA